MPSRRSLTVLSGAGEGLSNISQMLLKAVLQDSMQSRYDKRAHDTALATADRQREGNIDQVLSQLLKEGATNGNVDPNQIAAVSELLGRGADPEALERAMPARRRLETNIGKAIGDAKSPEDVPGDLDIISQAKSTGVNDLFPSDYLAENALTDNPFGNSPEPVADMGARAGAKRRALMEKPTQFITQQTETGAEQSVPASLYGGPVSTKPDAMTQGAIKGTEEVGLLGVAGDARAGQKGKEAKATQDVELSPEAVDARVNEAARTEAAKMATALPYQMKLAQQKALLDIQSSVDKEHAQNAQSAIAAATNLQPFFSKVSQLTAKINKYEGVMAKGAGAIQRGKQLMGTRPELDELDQVINQYLRPVAIAMGVKEANVSEKETLQALKGLGIGSAMATATNRRTGLRNLYDLMTIAPAVASRTSAETPIGQRMMLAQQLMEQRRAVEASAIKAGVGAYIDPVTNAITPVIK